jgi:uncharacterized protein (DUF697 family)
MRHYYYTRLEQPGYCIAFCDCGRELKRFVDSAGRDGRAQFQQWQNEAAPDQQWCNNCYQQKITAERAELARVGDLEVAALPQSLRGFLDDLSDAIKTIISGLDLSQATLAEKRAAADKISHLAATACVALALQPIPIADVLLITPIQIILVQSIGRIYGVPLSAKTAFEIATNIGLGVLLQQIFISMVKIGMPLMGGLLVSSYVYAATYYMGRVAQVYFEKGRPLTAQELGEMQASRSRAEDRLREIDQLKNAGLITEEEYQRKRAQIVDEI